MPFFMLRTGMIASCILRRLVHCYIISVAWLKMAPIGVQKSLDGHTLNFQMVKWLDHAGKNLSNLWESSEQLIMWRYELIIITLGCILTSYYSFSVHRKWRWPFWWSFILFSLYAARYCSSPGSYFSLFRTRSRAADSFAWNIDFLQLSWGHLPASHWCLSHSICCSNGYLINWRNIVVRMIIISWWRDLDWMWSV